MTNTKWRIKLLAPRWLRNFMNISAAVCRSVNVVLWRTIKWTRRQNTTYSMHHIAGELEALDNDGYKEPGTQSHTNFDVVKLLLSILPHSGSEQLISSVKQSLTSYHTLVWTEEYMFYMCFHCVNFILFINPSNHAGSSVLYTRLVMRTTQLRVVNNARSVYEICNFAISLPAFNTMNGVGVLQHEFYVTKIRTLRIFSG